MKDKKYLIIVEKPYPQFRFRKNKSRSDYLEVDVSQVEKIQEKLTDEMLLFEENQDNIYQEKEKHLEEQMKKLQEQLDEMYGKRQQEALRKMNELLLNFKSEYPEYLI